MSKFDSERAALAGVKVADFTWIGVGPLTTKYLADHGALVVHVESSKRPEMLRMSQPFQGGAFGLNRSQWFANYNTSKLGLSLDLNSEAGRAVALRLVQWADVVVENYTPKAMRKWGLDYEHLRQIKPDLVMVSSSMMGQTGPASGFAGHGQTGTALSGLNHFVGWPDRAPAQIYGAYTDFVAPRFLAVALLAALDYHRRTGLGLYIDQSQIESSIQMIGPAMLDWTANGQLPSRQGNRVPHAAPHGVYPCLPDGEGADRDRWVAIAVTRDQEWQALVREMGNPDWAAGNEFALLEQRKQRENELDDRLAAWTATATPHEVMQRLTAVGIPCGVVQRASDLFADPQLQHREQHRWLAHSEMGPVYANAPAFRLSATPAQQHAGPCMGEHNERILKEFLTYSDDEIADLLIAGVLE